MGKMIEIAEHSGPGKWGCYVAEPAASPRATIIVLQEVFGINAGIRAKCDAWADQGYLALAPDLFWRLQPGFEVDPDAEGALDAAIALMLKFDQDQGVNDIQTTINAARAMASGGKVGVVGYCMGGRLAFMVAARTDIDASVGYYGVGIDQLLGEAQAIQKPLMLHIPTADHFVPPPVQAAMHHGLDDHPLVTLHDYEGLDHGFATTFGQRRNDAAAKLADARTEAFFLQHLQPAG